MPARVLCSSCGAGVDLPAGSAKAKIRCPACGYYADVPPELRSAAPPPPAAPPAAQVTKAARPVARPVPVRRAIDPRDHRPQFEPDGPAGPPLLAGTRDEDDDKPYGVPGTGTKTCPHCRGQLPLAATLCVHCGRDLATGEKTDRAFQVVDRTWTEGWAPQLRLQVLAGAQVVNVVGFLLALLSDGLSAVTAGAVFWHLLFGAMNAAMQAFILGTYDTLRVRRSERGQASVVRVRRIGFLPLPPEKLPWKRSNAVGLVFTHSPGIIAWLVFAYLLLLACVPGVIFYFMVIRPDRFEVTLCDEYGGTDAVIFRSQDRDQATEVGEVAAECTGLWWKKNL